MRDLIMVLALVAVCFLAGIVRLQRLRIRALKQLTDNLGPDCGRVPGSRFKVQGRTPEKDVER